MALQEGKEIGAYNMPYEYRASSAEPRLLILLTDELEESVKVINRLIDIQIRINFNGDVPKNRCYISVIGYNSHRVKELCSGWLRDLDSSPLRLDRLKKRVPDGTGRLIEVEVQQPVWIDFSSDNDIDAISYRHAIMMAKEMSKSWVDDNRLLPPIIIDCSQENHAILAVDEIEELKNVASRDGNVLFFGTYSKAGDSPIGIFSKMPVEWKYRLELCELEKIHYSDGLLQRDKITQIISAITDIGGELAYT